MASKFNITAELNIQTKNLGQVVNNLRQQFQGANLNIKLKDLSLAQTRINSINKSTQATAKSMSSLGSSIGAAAKRFGAMALATGTFVGLTRAIKNSVSEAIEFEREMIKISQASGRTMAALKGLQNEIGQVSSNLGVSSKELVGATRNLVQAGFAANKVKEALKLLAQTELAGTFDSIADTTEGVIAILNQFGQQAQKAGTEIDFLEKSLSAISQVSKDFAVESSDLVTAVRTTGSAFQSAGGDLNELIGLFTSVRATTRESAESIATGFRTIFTRVQRVDTINALKELGIQLQDAEGKFVGPMEAAKRLSIALSTIDPKDFRFNVIVEELGGFRQVSKVIPLIQQFGTAQKAVAVAQKSTGSLAKDAATAQQSLAVQIEKVKEEFKAFTRELVGSPAFKETVTGALQMASAFIKIADSLKPLLPLIASFAAIKLGNAVLPALNTFMGGKRKAGGGVIGFASGGLVPGQGNGDTVPAMLTPGEFVIKKSSVKALGAENLAHANKYAIGGKARYNDIIKNIKGVKTADTSGKFSTQGKGKTGILQAAPLEGKNPLQFGGAFLRPSTSGKISSQIKQTLHGNVPVNGDWQSLDPEIKGAIQTSRVKGGSGVLNFDLQARSLDPAIGNKIDKNIKAYVIGAIDKSTKLLGLVDPQTATNADLGKIIKKSNIDSIVGNIFEAMLANAGAPFDSGASSSATFDFRNGLGGRASLFGDNALANIPTDAKSTYTTQNIGSFIKKAKNFIRDEIKIKKIANTPALKSWAEIGAQEKADILGKLGATDRNRIETGDKRSVGILKNLGFKLAKGGSTAGLTEIPWMASGGGVGTDTVPAMLTPGEFVINKGSAQKIGYGNLNRMNNVAKFATGGAVGVQHFADGGGVGGGLSPQNLLLLATAAGTLATQFSNLDDATKQAINTATLSFGIVKGIFGNAGSSLGEFAKDLEKTRPITAKTLGTFSRGLNNASVTIGALTAAANGYSEFLKADSAKLSKGIDDIIAKVKKTGVGSREEVAKKALQIGENQRTERALSAGTSAQSLAASATVQATVTTLAAAALRKSKYGKLISGLAGTLAGSATQVGFGAYSYNKDKNLAKQTQQTALAGFDAAKVLNTFNKIADNLENQSFERIKNASLALSGSMSGLQKQIADLEKAGAPSEQIEKLRNELDGLSEATAKATGELKTRTIKNIQSLVEAGKLLNEADIKGFVNQIGGSKEDQAANAAALAQLTAQAYRQEAALKREEDARNALVGTIGEERGIRMAAQKAKYAFERNNVSLNQIGGKAAAFSAIPDSGALELDARTKELDKALAFVTNVMGKRGAELSQNFLDLQDGLNAFEIALPELDKGIGANINYEKFFEDFFKKETGRSGGVASREMAKAVDRIVGGKNKSSGSVPGAVSRDASKSIKEEFQNYKKNLQEMLQLITSTFSDFESQLKNNLEAISESQAKVAELQLSSVDSLEKYVDKMAEINQKDLTLKQKDQFRSMRQSILGGAAGGNPQALLAQIRGAEEKRFALRASGPPKSVQEIVNFNKSIFSLSQTIENSKKALEALADQSGRTADIVELLGKEEGKRKAVGDLAKEFTFGTTASRDDLAKRIQALQVAMTTGDINNIPEELRSGVSQLLDQFKDVQLANGMTGEDISKRLQYNQLVGAGVNPQAAQSIFTKSSPEKQLIGELQKTFAQEQQARSALAQIEFDQQSQLNTNLKDLTQSIYQFLFDLKNNPDKINMQIANARAALANQGIRGAAPLSAEQLTNAANTFQAAADKFGEAVDKLAPKNKAGGGIIYRAGGGFQPRGTDTVPAMLTPGEFVVRKSAVDAVGVDTLNQINHMATGGYVGARRRIMQQQFAARQNMMMGQANTLQSYYNGSRRQKLLARNQERQNAAQQAEQNYQNRVATEANDGQGLMPNQRVATTVAGGTRVVTDVRRRDLRAERWARGNFAPGEVVPQEVRDRAEAQASAYSASISEGQTSAINQQLAGMAGESQAARATPAPITTSGTGTSLRLNVSDEEIQRRRDEATSGIARSNEEAQVQAFMQLQNKNSEARKILEEYRQNPELTPEQKKFNETARLQGMQAQLNEDNKRRGFSLSSLILTGSAYSNRSQRKAATEAAIKAKENDRSFYGYGPTFNRAADTLSMIPGPGGLAATAVKSAADLTTGEQTASSAAYNIGSSYLYSRAGKSGGFGRTASVATTGINALDAAKSFIEGDYIGGATSLGMTAFGARGLNKNISYADKRKIVASQKNAFAGFSIGSRNASKKIGIATVGNDSFRLSTPKTHSIRQIGFGNTYMNFTDNRAREKYYNKIKNIKSESMNTNFTPHANMNVNGVSPLDTYKRLYLGHSYEDYAAQMMSGDAGVHPYSKGGAVGYYAEGGGVQATIRNRAARGMYDASDNFAAMQNRNQIVSQGQQNFMNQMNGFNNMSMTHSLNVDGMLNIGGIDGEGIAGQISDGLGQYIGQIVMNMMQKHSGIKNTNPNGM
jgi:hypothetical protein